MRLAPTGENIRFYQRRFRQARMVARAIQSKDHPILAHIIPMRRCNLSCTYCNECDKFSDPVPACQYGTRKSANVSQSRSTDTEAGGRQQAVECATVTATIATAASPLMILLRRL